jgi:hypothetical protein
MASKHIEIAFVSSVEEASHVFDNPHNFMLIGKPQQVRCNSMALSTVIRLVDKPGVLRTDRSMPDALAMPRSRMVVARLRLNGFGILSKPDNHQSLVGKLTDEGFELDRIECQKPVVRHGDTSGFELQRRQRVITGSDLAVVSAGLNDGTHMPEVLLSGIQMEFPKDSIPALILSASKGEPKDRLVVPNVALVRHISLLCHWFLRV